MTYRLIAALLILSRAALPFPSQADPLTLIAAGTRRPLLAPVFGASTTQFYERLFEDPDKMATLKTMAIGLDRFPGGSDANFYDWRAGLFAFEAKPNSSAYVKFWVQAAAAIARGKPSGVGMERFASFSRDIAAETILVPNLESSTVAEQVAWFKSLTAKGLVPKRIELGNEFWVAMGNDPASLARWPDAPTSMGIMKEYLDALRPYLTAGSKAAVQAAAGALDVRQGAFARRLRQWDEDLKPGPWFDAVTIHLYPRLRDVMGDPNAGLTAPTAENAGARLSAMMARVDNGTESILRDIERRLPGKELWVTEWNARGANPETQRGRVESLSPAMEMQTTARMALTFLRHPSVTAALFFMLSFNPRDAHAMFVADGRGGYAPLPAAAALRWLNEAANAGGEFQRLVPKGARPVRGGGARDESFLPVEGGLFVSGTRTVLLVQNASSAAYALDPASIIADRWPARVEILAEPDLADSTRRAARIETVDAAGMVGIPPFSLTRLVWTK